MRPLAELFHRIDSGDEVYACVSFPPRHSKTLSILNWIARYIQRYPAKTVAYVTYAANLAESKSRICRDLTLRLGVRLKRDSKSLTEWRTLQGGGFLCTGRDGALTGHGVDLLIIDDPLSNREEAESQIIKDKLEAWFTSTAMTRLEPGGSVIVNGTRWAKDDLIGRILQDDTEGWEYINIPAINDDGEALWPNRWPVEKLQKRRRIIGEYDWASLYQGQPIPKEGVAFGEPTYYNVANIVGARLVISVDPAATSKNYADHSVICVASAVGKKETQIVDILDIWRGQVEIPALVQKIKEIAEHWGAPVYVESIGGFKAVPQMLRSIAPNLKIYENYAQGGDKFTRALPLIAAWANKRVRLPKDKEWVKHVLRETDNFSPSGSKVDDIIDAMQIAFTAINKTRDPMDRGIRKLLS
jgi:predicted phage terminase large subunit-like protein